MTAARNIDHSYTNEIVCPRCGYEFSDSWEASASGEDECPECEKKFEYERHVTATYSTWIPEPKKARKAPEPPPEDRRFEIGPCPVEARAGALNLYDTNLGVWEETVDEPAMRRVLYRLLAHLHARGFRFERDVAHCSVPSNDDWLGKRGALEIVAATSGRTVKLEFFQNVHIENPNGGRYDHNKYKRMPRTTQLECVTELALLAKLLCDLGYVFNEKLPRGPEPLPLRIRDALRRIGPSDPLELFNAHWTNQRFERDETGFISEKVYRSWSPKDRDGVPMRTGDTRYFYAAGWLMRGTVYPSVNGQWLVAYAGLLEFRQTCEFFSCDPEKTPRRFVPKQRERLVRELEKAVKSEAYARVATLGRVLEKARS